MTADSAASVEMEDECVLVTVRAFGGQFSWLRVEMLRSPVYRRCHCRLTVYWIGSKLSWSATAATASNLAP